MSTNKRLTPEEQRSLRELCFVPCQTSNDLWRWCKIYLGVELPEGRVDPDSNSSPMEFLWEVYALMARGGDPEMTRLLAFASRDSQKTLVAAVIETLAIVHWRRAVVHLAAVEAQSQKCARYVRQFMERPVLRDFKLGDNKRDLEFVRCQRLGDLRENLTERQWRALPEALKDNYERISLLNEITVCTLQGANAKHAPLLVLDELDVISNPKAYEEAGGIPSPPEHDPDQLPVTLLFSTRKTAIGLVQDEIDKAPITGLVVRHWNYIDVTRGCAPARHRPDLPKLPIYVDDSTAEALSEQAWQDLPEKRRSVYERREGYAGCLLNCKLFGSCGSRLASRPGRDVRFLKPVTLAQEMYRAKSTEMWISQYLCRKPPKSGMIYPRLDEELHLRTAQQLAEMVTGAPRLDVDSREKLQQLLVELGCKFALGQDYGFTHPFASVFAALFGSIVIVLDYIEESGLEATEQVERCKRYLPYDPDLYGDVASPGSLKSFRKAGFKVRTWKKGKNSVVEGIDAVRAKLRPSASDPELFFLHEPAVVKLFQRLSKYHYHIDPTTGEPTDEPDETDDDAADATRYLIMNVTGGGKMLLSVGPGGAPAEQPSLYQPPSQFDQLMQHVGPLDEAPSGAPIVHSKGRLKYAI